MSESPTPPLIHARGLTKRFGDFTAVDAVDFDVAPGESFGFLGPNGAGKTTAIKLLAEVEGIIPALESAHAIAAVGRLAPKMSKNQIIIINLSGRGDKDMETVGDYLGVKL